MIVVYSLVWRHTYPCLRTALLPSPYQGTLFHLCIWNPPKICNFEFYKHFIGSLTTDKFSVYKAVSKKLTMISCSIFTFKYFKFLSVNVVLTKTNLHLLFQFWCSHPHRRNQTLCSWWCREENYMSVFLKSLSLSDVLVLGVTIGCHYWDQYSSWLNKVNYRFIQYKLKKGAHLEQL